MSLTTRKFYSTNCTVCTSWEWKRNMKENDFHLSKYSLTGGSIRTDNRMYSNHESLSLTLVANSTVHIAQIIWTLYHVFLYHPWMHETHNTIPTRLRRETRHYWYWSCIDIDRARANLTRDGQFINMIASCLGNYISWTGVWILNTVYRIMNIIMNLS